MTDVDVGVMSSTVQTADSEALLHPAVLARITEAVLAAVREEQAYEQRVADEQRLRSGVSARDEGWR
jgi:hypothetical protein